MKDFKELAQNVIDGIESGIRGLQEIQIEIDQLKDQLKDFEEIKAQIEPVALQEIEDLGGEVETDFYKMVRRSGRVVWDFKHLDEWNLINDRKKEVENRYKQSFKASQSNLMMANQDGEVLEFPKVKYTKDFIMFKPV